MPSVNTINAKTGLRESWNDHFKIPTVHQAGLEGIRFDPHPVAIHAVPVDEVPSLDFYAKIAPADELYVSLQGAVTPGKVRYPSFWRIASMRNRVPAFMAFADPTLQLSDNELFGLAWYTGGPGWDPIQQLAQVVRQAMDHAGASHAMFLGGSGGGFAALRLATLFPQSIAFVQDPQTRVSRFNEIHQKRLIKSCWPDWGLEDVYAQHPERFDLVNLYAQTLPENFVYYRQSTSDPHLQRHAEPFRDATAGTPGAQAGRFRFEFEAGEKPGHGRITAAEFDRHFDQAVAWWRENRVR